MKKILLAILILCAFGITEGSAMSEKPLEEREFRFEDYKDQEKAKEHLLALHPVGSDVGSILERLRKLGPTHIKTLEPGNKLFGNNKEISSKTFFYHITHKVIFTLDWIVSVSISKEKKIIAISVQQYVTGM